MNTKAYTHVSVEERETLSLGLSQGHALRTMATVVGRPPSTLSRAHPRHATRNSPYRACTAQPLALARLRQARRPRKLLDPWRWRSVRTHLVQGHSPEQIAGRLRHEYPDEMRKHRSAETLDVGVDVLPRGTVRSKLLTALRQGRKARRPRARGTDRRGQIPHMRLIAERPAEVRDPHRPRSLGRRSDQGSPHWFGRGPPRGTDLAPGHRGPAEGNECTECVRRVCQEAPAHPGPVAETLDR